MTQWMIAMESIVILWICCMLASSLTMDSIGHTGVDAADLRGVPCHYDITSEGLKATCSHRYLTAVPTNLTHDITVLDLTQNQLNKLDNTSFTSLPHLRYLYLQSNNMSTIESGAFQSLPELYLISLLNNNFTSLPTNIFSKNQKLQIVDLTANQFVSFPGNALDSVSSLTQLRFDENFLSRLNFTGWRSRNMTSFVLNDNRFSSFHEDDFLPLKETRIDQISFTKNNLTSLQNGLFQHLEGVREMSLTSNHIHNFSLHSFLGMSSLETLYVDTNVILAIKPLAPLLNQTNVMPNLTYLDLQGNRIPSIPPRAFWGLGNLIRLDIHQSRIKTLQNDTFQGLESLEILDLTGNHLSYVTKDMFVFSPRLQSLILSSNWFTELSPKQIGDIASLTSLNLARCGITDFRTQSRGWNLRNLKSLDISYNRLVRIDKNSFYGMPNLTTLDISNNRLLTTIENGAFASIGRLQSLSLSHLSYLGQLHSPFTNLNELTILDMSYTSVALSYELFTGLSNLRRLSMRGSGLTASSFWDSHTEDLPVLSALPTLERLYLKGNKLDRLKPGTFQGLQNLHNLEMDNSDITSLNEDVFLNLTSLEYLFIDENHIAELTSRHLTDLSSLVGVHIKSNEIKGLASDVFSNNPHLSYLYISHNHLTTVKEGTVLPRQTLDVSNNPFSCNCELTWFINWINKAEVSIIHPDQTNCSSVSLAPFKNQPILAFDPTEVCGPKVWVYIITIFVIVTCIMVCVVAYQRRWLINYKLFHLKLVFLGRRDDHDGRERLDYEYDINLAFDDDDEQWVRGILKPGLEERLPDFNRIVCGDDDLPLGMYYIEAITEVVEQSYKSILIVSNRAVENHSFISKLRLAVDQMNEVELEKVILIFKEDIPDGRLPYLVRLFLSKNKPYFRWSKDKYGKKIMWENLVRELGYNKKMNDILPI
ncbi:insulin-like growth factor-binding protein complex acid labile subunit [Strongylocentrotus purpuratus]|uniref:TIR domain-containing protein n=1 Tax=Strongylocentrotus purpuratus TaxID=7668 RepID=A0A7M7HIW0_STRPU|nr:insulin-like growth factor-binding protein complex acid labile subunit [Strongylocentrotus purpuratus]